MPVYPPDVQTPPRSPWRDYLRISRSATYGFLSALPLILLYEVMVYLANRGSAAQIRVGAEVWLKQLLVVVGDTGFLVIGGVVVAIGVAIFFYERGKDLPLRGRYFGWMIAESAVYAFLVALLVSGLVGALFALAPVGAAGPALQRQGLFMQLALSVGAGVYEELLFRVLLVGGLYALLKRLLPERTYAYVIAAVVGAFLFSAVHYAGPLGDAFTLASFTFRFFFGVALNVLYLVRGFGIAAWTHALYDVMVVTGFLG